MTRAQIVREEIERLTKEWTSAPQWRLPEHAWETFAEQVALRCMARWEEYLGEMACPDCGLRDVEWGSASDASTCAEHDFSVPRVLFNRWQKEKV